MTPAINKLKKGKISFKTHSYQHVPGTKAYGEEAAEKLALPFEKVFKTLIVQSETNDYFVALVPVSCKLHLKAFAKSINAKKVKMADKTNVQRITGYLLGGVSPIAQKKTFKTVIDDSALEFSTIFVSAGRRGLQVELSPEDLAVQTHADFYSIAVL